MTLFIIFMQLFTVIALIRLVAYLIHEPEWKGWTVPTFIATCWILVWHVIGFAVHITIHYKVLGS